MKLIIKYSLLKELKEALNVLFHLDEYKYLRLFIMPTPRSVLSFAVNKNIGIKKTTQLWSKYESEVQQAFQQLDL